MDDGTGTADETLAVRTPAFVETQRQLALMHLAAAQQALRCGQITTAQTKLGLVVACLRSMEPEGRP